MTFDPEESRLIRYPSIRKFVNSSIRQFVNATEHLRVSRVLFANLRRAGTYMTTGVVLMTAARTAFDLVGSL